MVVCEPHLERSTCLYHVELEISLTRGIESIVISYLAYAMIEMEGWGIPVEGSGLRAEFIEAASMAQQKRHERFGRNGP